MAASRLNLDNFPASPHAEELRHEPLRLAFAGELEDAYRLSHLEKVRRRAQVWTTLGVALSVVFTAREVAALGWSSTTGLMHLLLIAPASFALAWLVFSTHYTRVYLRLASVFAPLIGITVGFFSARAVGNGAAEELVLLALLTIAIFFLLGLLFRPAVFAAAVTLVAFGASAWIIGVPTFLLLKDTMLIAVTAVLAGVICWDVEQSYRRRFLEEALIAQLAERDPLTGLKNRRAFDEHYLRLWQQSQRKEGCAIGFLYIDVDHFKRYNDEYGHQSGDSALRKVADVAKDCARRPLDIAARLGGEEFAVVLYDVSHAHVIDVAERLKLGVEMLGIVHRGSDHSQRLTVSIGVAVAQPRIGRSPAGLIQMADEALYKAKGNGRNCVVVEGDTEYASLVTGTYRRPQRL